MEILRIGVEITRTGANLGATLRSFWIALRVGVETMRLGDTLASFLIALRVGVDTVDLGETIRSFWIALRVGVDTRLGVTLRTFLIATRVGVDTLRLGVDFTDETGVDPLGNTREIGAKDPYLGETGLDFLTAVIILILNVLGGCCNPSCLEEGS